MNLADCYKLLGLNSEASRSEIKASYRRLAKIYHPDVNPKDRQAKEKFIAITEAYEILLNIVKEPGIYQTPTSGKQQVSSPPEPTVKVTRKKKPEPPRIELSPEEQKLKWRFYEQLQVLLKEERFPRAIAVAEGLANRLPQDPEVCQWLAITYQLTGRFLINEKQLDKARLYLKKALKTDPHNRSLWSEVERDFRRIEQLY